MLMRNCSKQSCVSFRHFFGTSFYLNFHILPVRTFNHHIYRIIINHRNVYIKTPFEHFPN